MLNDTFFKISPPKSFIEQFEKISNMNEREAQLAFLNIISCDNKMPDRLNDLISIGYACNNHGLLLSMGAQCFAVATALKQFLDDSLQKTIKQEITAGKKIAAFAATETEAGSDIMAMQACYECKDNKFVLNGKKCYITNATTADYILVFATKNPKLYDRGLSLFVVSAKAPGVTVNALETKRTLKHSGLGNIVFDNVLLDDTALVGKEYQAAAIFKEALKIERAYILMPHIGTMLRWYHQCIKYAQSRRQFKKPLYQFQYIADKIVDMHEKIKISFLLARDLCQANEVTDASASLLKNYVSEALQTCHVHAINIYGASGFLGDNPLSNDLADSFSASIYSGTREIQKSIILNAILDGNDENIS